LGVPKRELWGFPKEDAGKGLVGMTYGYIQKVIIV
jgi:hypothetical protein